MSFSALLVLSHRHGIVNRTKFECLQIGANKVILTIYF